MQLVTFVGRVSVDNSVFSSASRVAQRNPRQPDGLRDDHAGFGFSGQLVLMPGNPRVRLTHPQKHPADLCVTQQALLHLWAVL